MPDLYVLEPKESELDNENSPFHSIKGVFDGFLIRAFSCHNARRLAERLAREWSMKEPEVWMDHNRTQCKRVSQTGQEEILLWSCTRGAMWG